MKKTLLFSACLYIATVGFSQVPFENASFENWDALGNPEEEPTQYSSLKTADALAGLAPQVLWQSGTAHTGSFSARLVVAPYNILVGLAPNGTMTNGRVHAELTASNGYVFTDAGNSQWNTPCTDRPDSLVGWFQYTPQNGDKGKVEVLLHDNTLIGKLPHDGTTTHWVGKARYDITTTTSSWTRFSVPFTYYNGSNPDYVLLVATAGDSLIAEAGSELLLDDIELIYNPAPTVTIAPTATQNINVSVDGSLLTATEMNGTAVSRQWMSGAATGGPYTAITPAQTGTTYLPNFAAAGIYYVVCETDFGTQTVISNEVEIVVVDPGTNTVTVTPSAVQTVLTDQNGNLLTATETPSAATTREWKVSSTSGSGYASFGTPETGLTYTPYFSALGTYYVICEADFAGDIKISNEVVINVPSSAGIDDEDLKFKIYSENKTINLTFESELNEAVLSIYNLEGKQVYISQITSATSQHTLEKSGIYIYRLVSGDRIITGKISL